MTGEQVRTARELLGWSTLRLSLRAGIPQGALITFEKTGRMPAAMHHRRDRVQLVCAALEGAGVEFTPQQPSVRLRTTGPG